jgi:glycosyltransferase involved in cell wall biosynthesis
MIDSLDNSKESPLFSVVIANYNHGKFLEEAIKSVLNQSCTDFELIIVDGRSTDNSVEIIKKYEDKLAWWVSESDG